MFFFWTRSSRSAHDVDVKALLRVAVVHNCRSPAMATADFLFSSRLIGEQYDSPRAGLSPVLRTPPSAPAAPVGQAERGRCDRRIGGGEGGRRSDYRCRARGPRHGR